MLVVVRDGSTPPTSPRPSGARASAVWGSYVRANGPACAPLSLRSVKLLGCCVWVSHSASAALELCALNESPRQGVLVSGAHAIATLLDCSIQHAVGHGVLVENDATATLRGCSIEDCGLDGVFVGGSASVDCELCTIVDNERCGVGR